MVGSALARMVLSSEPMNTGSSTPSTTSIVSRWVRGFGVTVRAKMSREVSPRSFRDGAERCTRNPDGYSEIASGFRVRAFGAPRNDGQLSFRPRLHRVIAQSQRLTLFEPDDLLEALAEIELEVVPLRPAEMRRAQYVVHL